MQTNFEKKIREKLHDFKLEPSNNVWKDISSSLDAPEKRRVIAWWMLAAGFAFVGIIAAGFLMRDSHSASSAKNNIEKTNSFANQQPASVSANSNPSSDHLLNSNILPETNYSTQKKSATTDISETKDQKEIAVVKKDISDEIKGNTLQGQHQNNVVEKANLKNDRNNISSSLNSSSSQNNVVDKTTSSTKNNSAIFQSKNNASVLNTDENKMAETKKPTTDLQKSNPVTQTAATAKSSFPKQTKRSHWSFLFGGGSTNTINENFLFAKSKPLIYHNNSGASDTVKSMRPAYPGFHVTGGIQYSFALNRRWTLYSGLQYSFLLNHQRTGKQVSQESEISNAVDTFATASQHFYKILSHYADGTSQLNTNYASWLEMPVSFGYKINPRSKVNVELRGGVSLTHMFGDKWLIPDGRYNKFYYSNELTNNYIVNAHEDVVLTLPKHKIIGLQFQHSITSLGKSPVQPALYWSNISLYTTIPLK